MRAALAAALASAALLAPGPARAWNARGHRVVARIAEARLDPAARARARALLGGAHLADVATWADGEAKLHPETRPWHWVNIGAQDGGYDRARHCPDGACVVEQIVRLAGVLRDPAAPPGERARALRFLVHLVADVHQPLHAGRAEDRGGNAILVAAPAGAAPLSLHGAYDDLPDACLRPRRERRAAARLDASIPPEAARAWAASSPADWATESHLLALHAYASAPPSGGDPRPLPPGAGRCAMARGQLGKAAVRLAALLDDALR